MSSWLDALAFVNSIGILLILLGPPCFLALVYLHDRTQTQHAVLRNFPLLGRLRYLLEHIGPELRQYLFDADRAGKPFSRDEYTGVVMAGKYMKTLTSFGSKRDFDQPGWYLRNAFLPTPIEDLAVERDPMLQTQRYVLDEDGLFHRREHVERVDVSPWTLPRGHEIVVGPDLPRPWRLRGHVGMSGMSYGALGRNAIQAMSQGLGAAGAAWMNTGEGGLSPHHESGDVPIVFQIGPGLFGVRTEDGQWDWDAFASKAALDQVVAFELKFHQGAKIRGGHIEGEKVTPEIAEIRRVPVGQTIDSPNRFSMFEDTDGFLDWVARMREISGKPVGVKVVVGGPGSLDELAQAMARRGDGPDFISVDGSEGGSGAMYREMADTMGLPLYTALVEADDTLRRFGVRERVKVFASGKLSSPDRAALALCFGADAINVARGMMVSVGCIQAQRCHTNECPVGVATTDEKKMGGLVVAEKRHRVTNYVITLRAGLYGLAAAAGLESPSGFARKHAVHRDQYGRSRDASELFPYPLSMTERDAQRPRSVSSAGDASQALPVVDTLTERVDDEEKERER